MRKTIASCLSAVSVTLAALSVAGCDPENSAAATTSSLPTVPSVVVPDVSGDRPTKAKAALEAAGFTVKFANGTGRAPNGSECVVSTQDPKAGTQTGAGATVTVHTSGIVPPHSQPGDPGAVC
ncbi:PASTA domain-containing protein [Nocardia tengchongensis]|uniref:PASTA domain-containing protein n=1 Tax=Nocardia tengchongensis TaxID=2055889 RepID=UPI003677377E